MRSFCSRTNNDHIKNWNYNSTIKKTVANTEEREMWSEFGRNCTLYMHYYYYVTVTTYNSGG